MNIKCLDSNEINALLTRRAVNFSFIRWFSGSRGENFHFKLSRQPGDSSLFVSYGLLSILVLV
jgi:hypothetical protein